MEFVVIFTSREDAGRFIAGDPFTVSLAVGLLAPNGSTN